MVASDTTPLLASSEDVRHVPQRSRAGSVATDANEGDTTMVETGLSPWRWWALLVFSVLATYMNVAWISYSTIVDEATEYYSVSSGQIQLLIAVCSAIFIPAVFVINPLSDRFGLRVGVILSTALIMVGSVCRWLGGSSYVWCFVGQALNGMAGPIICNAPAQLASEWFPIEHRATATAIAWSSQSVGVAAAYVLVPYTVGASRDLAAFNAWMAYVSFGVMALSCTFPRPPRLPASYSAAFEKEGFFVGAKALWGNRCVNRYAVPCSARAAGLPHLLHSATAQRSQPIDTPRFAARTSASRSPGRSQLGRWSALAAFLTST